MSLVMALSTLESRLARRFDQHLGLHGISYREFLVLHHLAQAPGQALSRGELAELVSLSASGITRMLRPMEKIGLVEKKVNPRDARSNPVKLSPAGQTIYADALQTFSEGAGASMKPLTAGKIAQCRELLGEILR